MAIKQVVPPEVPRSETLSGAVLFHGNVILQESVFSALVITFVTTLSLLLCCYFCTDHCRRSHRVRSGTAISNWGQRAAAAGGLAAASSTSPTATSTASTSATEPIPIPTSQTQIATTTTVTGDGATRVFARNIDAATVFNFSPTTTSTASTSTTTFDPDGAATVFAGNITAETTFTPSSTARSAARDGGGLSPEAVSMLPVFVCSFVAATEKSMCTVCQMEFKEGDEARILPCFHCFHMKCVDTWFNSHSTCPVCRTTVESTNLAA